MISQYSATSQKLLFGPSHILKTLHSMNIYLMLAKKKAINGITIQNWWLCHKNNPNMINCSIDFRFVKKKNIDLN